MWKYRKYNKFIINKIIYLAYPHVGTCKYKKVSVYHQYKKEETSSSEAMWFGLYSVTITLLKVFYK
jgi:hypothetical protein